VLGAGSDNSGKRQQREATTAGSDNSGKRQQREHKRISSVRGLHVAILCTAEVLALVALETV